MVKRIIFDSSGVRVSRAGFDAATASRENLIMHPNMNPLIPVYQGEAVFTANGTRTFTFANSRPNDPVTIILRGSDGRLPHQTATFYATTQAPFTSLKIHNVDGRARTIQFRVLL